MAAESDIVRITYKELEDIAQLNEEREEEEKNRKIKEEAKKKRDNERKKRPTIAVYQPPHRHKPDKSIDPGGTKESSPEETTSKPVVNELHISEENWEEEIVSESSSKENSVEKELASVNSGLQDLKMTVGDSQKSRRSHEMRRKKKPEIQRYVPKARLQQKQKPEADASGEGSGDWEDELSSPSPKQVHSPSPGPATSALVHSPHTPSPRKIDLKNMQVTVANNKSGPDDTSRSSPEKHVDQPVKSANRDARTNEQEYTRGKGQGQSYSRGRGQRQNQRSNEPRHTKGQVGNRYEDKEQRSKREHKETKEEKVNSKADRKQNVTNKQNKDVKSDQELYIVPSRPSTIGQEADRKDTAPVGMEENKNKIDENKPSIDKQEILNRFKRTPNKTKSRSYDKLNQADRFDDEDAYYPDPQNLNTMVFERSHSSEQLNLSGRNLGKPPMPRSSSGGIKNTPKKHAYSGMRKRTDSVSSDLSTGTGSDWSTEELDFDKEPDNTSKIDWNEDVERELALQVQDETQKMQEWFERQELGLSQKDSHRDLTNNAKTDVMTSSTPGYLGGFPVKSDLWSERSSTLPLPKKKQNAEPRGRTDRRRGSLGFRSRDSSLSSVHSTQSVHSVQSAYSGDGRRRRRRRRKSSGGSQKGRSGSMEHMNISVTCGGRGNRREVKVDNFKGRSSENLSRQNSSEGPSRRGSRDESWKGSRDESWKGPRDEHWRDRGYRGDERGRGGKGPYRGGRGRGFDKRGSYEELNEPYYSRDRWVKDEGQSRQNDRGRNYSGGRGSDNRHYDSNRDNWDDRRQSHRGRGRGYDRRDRDDHNRGHRDNRDSQDKFPRGRDQDWSNKPDTKAEHQPHGGGILHINPQSKEQDNSTHHNVHQRKAGSHEPDRGWGRGHAPERGGSHPRERQHSGSSHRQKTLFDPNNPSKPIVIEEAKPKLEFKDTDSYPSSPQSPQYMGGAPPPPPDMYGNRGYMPFYPPGYGYGYNMPPMMPPPPGMFDPYGYQMPQDGYRESSPYQDDPYYQSGMDVDPQMAGRSRSRCRMMAEQLLRETIPLDKQLNQLISRRIGGEDTLHMINQLRRELQMRCEKLILLDPDLATKQNVEQMLWKSVFHHMVELIRRQLAEDHAEETKLSLNKILDEGAVFYESLLDKIQKTFNFNLTQFLDPNILPPENLGRTIKLALLSCQKTMICLGDVARYKEQNNDTGKVNYAKARNWYSKAQQIAPKNGRPYNQLAILALYTKHKLDAVYYYMRSLAASNPFLTARESLMSLFNEARKKAEVNEKQRFEERKKHEDLRKNRNVREHRVEIWIKNDGTSSASKVDDNFDEDLSKLDTVQLNKRFVLSFLNVHGKLFTKIGMEMFPDSCGQMLNEFKVLLKDNAIGPQRLLQLMAMNMFAIENTALKDESLESTCKSLLQQHSVQMGLDMFGILVEKCTQLLAVHIKSDDYPGRMFSRELEELVPGIKVWTNWMICHADLWNPPPQVRDPAVGPDIDVWTCTATLCNLLKEMNTSYVKFHTERNDGLEAVILPEDMMMSGFVPLLTTPLTSTFVENTVDKDIARDCLRVEKLRVFGEYLCGVEPPMLAYSAETKKYYSVAPSDGYEDKDHNDGLEQHDLSEEDDVVIEDEEIVNMDNTDDQHVQHLKARKEELEKRVEEKKRLHEHRKKVVETNRHSCIEIEIRPIFLIPDTNCFIDHLPSLKKLISDRQYNIVIPLVVINELDGLAQGQRTGQFDNEDHANKVKHRAANTVEMLESEFEKKNTRLKALTSKGSVMETISFRSEETDSSGNNDDLILSCCTYYCKDKARDYMPKDKDTPVRLHREVVLLTDDRNLRLKAHTHNVPVKDIPAFMKWSSST